MNRRCPALLVWAADQLVAVPPNRWWRCVSPPIKIFGVVVPSPTTNRGSTSSWSRAEPVTWREADT
jgi:hypothetical protein